MHRYFMFLAAALLAGQPVQALQVADAPRVADIQQARPLADLTVTVAGLASSSGKVFAALHDGAEGFPSDREPVSGTFVRASEGSVTFVFKGVPPGRYAVAVFHDRNGDRALSTSFLGVPAEPFGFSRDARGVFGPPAFEDAAFEIGPEGTGIMLRVSR